GNVQLQGRVAFQARDLCLRDFELHGLVTGTRKLHIGGCITEPDTHTVTTVLRPPLPGGAVMLSAAHFHGEDIEAVDLCQVDDITFIESVVIDRNHAAVAGHGRYHKCVSSLAADGRLRISNGNDVIAFLGIDSQAHSIPTRCIDRVGFGCAFGTHRTLTHDVKRSDVFVLAHQHLFARHLNGSGAIQQYGHSSQKAPLPKTCLTFGTRHDNLAGGIWKYHRAFR